jgi:hypothetical protein
MYVALPLQSQETHVTMKYEKTLNRFFKPWRDEIAGRLNASSKHFLQKIVISLLVLAARVASARHILWEGRLK